MFYLLLFFWCLIVSVGSFALSVLDAVDDARDAGHVRVRPVVSAVFVFLASFAFASFAFDVFAEDWVDLSDCIMAAFFSLVFSVGDWGVMRRSGRRVLGRVCLGAVVLSALAVVAAVAVYCTA